MRLILMDDEEKQIEATMFNEEIDLYSSMLLVGKSYKFSNANVKFIDPAFRTIDNNYQLIINRQSRVEETLEENQFVPEKKYNFTPLTNLVRYLHESFEIDIIAVVLDVLPIDYITRHMDNVKVVVRELLIVDQNLQPIHLSTWNDFPNCECERISELLPHMPIITATHIKVQSFKGLSLSTRPFTEIMINPDIIQAKEMQSWSINNIKILNELSSQKVNKARNIDGSFSKFKSSSIKNVLDAAENMKCSIEATITKINMQNQAWYMSCSRCMKKTNEQCGKRFECQYCHTTTTAEARCILRIEINDGISSTWITIFGEYAEKLLMCTANELKEGVSLKTLAEKIIHKKFTFHVTSSEDTFQNRGCKKLNVVGLKDISSSTEEHDKEYHRKKKSLKIEGT